MGTSKKAVLVGYHGKANFGDDIFRRLILRFMRSDLGVVECSVVVAGEDAFTESSEEPRVVRVRNRFPAISRLRWLSVFNSSLNADFLVFGGGSLFTQRSFLEASLTLRLLRGINPKLKVIGLGVSVGPLPSGAEASCASFLSHFDMLLLRDSNSGRLAESLGVLPNRYLAGHDLALLCDFGGSTEKPQKVTKQILGVSLTRRAISHMELEMLCVEIGSALRHNSQLEVRILVACADSGDGDLGLSELCFNLLRDHEDQIEMVVHSDQQSVQFIEAVSECDAVIACRMHIGIVSMMMGKPALQVAYEPKVASFYSDLGLDDRDLVVDGEELSKRLPSFVLRFLSGDTQNHCQKNRQTLVERGSAQARLINELAKRI